MSLEKIKQLIQSEFDSRNHFDFEKITVGFPYFDSNEIMSVLDSLLSLNIF